MHLLIITRNFPPLQGGIERLVKNAAMQLSTRFEVILCAPRGARDFFPEGVETKEVPHLPLWRFLASSFISAASLVRRYKPAIILGGSGLAGPAARILAWIIRRPAVVYLHGLDIVVDNFLYRRLFLPFVRRCDLLLVNSESTRQLAVKAGIPADRIRVLHPGVELPKNFGSKERNAAIADFKTRFDLHSRPTLLSVGRLTQRKGLCEFISQCLPHIVTKYPDCRLLVIGDDPVNALLAESISQRRRAEQLCRDLNLAENVIFLGEINDDAFLSVAYESADAMVFPVLDRARDIEGFGMVAIEAAANDTPTIAFAVGGVPDAVAEGISGRLLAPGNYAGMTSAIIEILDHEVAYPGCRDFASRFAWPEFGEKLSHLISDTISNAK